MMMVMVNMDMAMNRLLRNGLLLLLALSVSLPRSLGLDALLFSLSSFHAKGSANKESVAATVRTPRNPMESASTPPTAGAQTSETMMALTNVATPRLRFSKLVLSTTKPWQDMNNTAYPMPSTALETRSTQKFPVSAVPSSPAAISNAPSI